MNEIRSTKQLTAESVKQLIVDVQCPYCTHVYGFKVGQFVPAEVYTHKCTQDGCNKAFAFRVYLNPSAKSVKIEGEEDK